MNKIAFLDSGVGGLIFALEAISSISNHIENNRISLDVLHVGDELNMPYGLKKQEELVILISNLINIAKERNYKNIILACNTACSALSLEYFTEKKAEGINVVSIIDISAEALYDKALEKSSSSKIKIALFGTKRTIESKIYVKKLSEIHRGRKTAKTLEIFDYAPIEWEQEIERAITGKEKINIVNKHLEIFYQKYNKHLENLSSVALFCTHYPYLTEEIKLFFNQKNIHPEIITQGVLFSNLIKEMLTHSVAEDIQKEDCSKISIHSISTDSNSQHHSSVLINRMYPEVRVEFSSLNKT